MYCRSCGENIPVDSIFCPSCGKNLMEVSSPTTVIPPASSAGPVAPQEDVDDTERAPLSRLRRMRRNTAIPVEEESQNSADEEEEPRTPWVAPAWLQQLTLSRVLWAMGLLFAIVGFVVGLLGHLDMSLAWLLLGLVLIVAAPAAPQVLLQESNNSAENHSIEEEMGD